MDIRELDLRASATLGDVIAKVRLDQLRLPTPCDDWTLHGLIRHQVSDNLGFVAAANGVTDDILAWDAGRLGDDPLAAYNEAADAMAKAFADDVVLDRSLQIREFGFFPGSMALSMHVTDCVVHGWDVAQSIGVPYSPDLDLVEHALGVAAFIPTGADPNERPRSAFAPIIKIADDAAPLDRLLGLVGRRP
ncbi:TIGR03086 family protein [Planotetraspora silvatica]|uniref:TIGR03086 family protein n=1 Tax=Planotetraspora silvatica TaxID=234614 RepID=A0A8J3UQ08_9ACTN|nr:TIGR03086 family metal-binding protein [Planotetraspora silvatica]GII47371.1 TIGR03086 family protein [Planotetraspora silvatica]